MRPAVVLLPGLDGTGRLFRWIADPIAEVAEPVVVSYPTDRFLAFDELAEYVRAQLPTTPWFMVAESFSGPVGVTIAATAPPGLRGVILSTSFVSRPAARWLTALPLELVLRIAISGALLPRILLNARPEDPMSLEVMAVIRSVPTALLAARVRQSLVVDASDALRRCSAPVAYLAATEDRLLGGRGLASVRRARPGIDVVDIKGSHLLLQGASEQAAGVIAAYGRKWLAS